MPPIPAPQLRTFRDAIKKLSPRWLRSGIAEKLLYTVGLHLDLIGDTTAEAVRRRFPGFAGEQDAARYDSLGLIGRERRIRRGRAESNPTYSNRLVPWLDDHARRGGPYAMLQQVGAFWAAAPFQIDLIYRTGRRFIRDIAGAVTRDDIAWDPDTEPERHARWWMVFFWPNAINSDGLWDDPGVWDDGGVWDSDLTAEDVADVRIVPADWNNARCQGTIVLLPPEIELWDYPIGTWDEPGGVWADDYSAVTVSVD